MSYSLSWTTRAEETFNKNIEYLELEWSNSVLNKFLDRVEYTLENISDNPYLYPLHNSSKDIRRCIINGRIILYFRIIDDNTIDLITFFNTWQNPDKLEF